MTSLNYASLKDAFSPLEGVRKRRAEEGHDPASAAEGTARAARRQHYYDEGPPHPPAPPPHPPAPPHPSAPPHARTFLQELALIQPYLNNLFMILVIGMLYDIRTVAKQIAIPLLAKLSLGSSLGPSPG